MWYHIFSSYILILKYKKKGFGKPDCPFSVKDHCLSKSRGLLAMSSFHSLESYFALQRPTDLALDITFYALHLSAPFFYVKIVHLITFNLTFFSGLATSVVWWVSTLLVWHNYNLHLFIMWYLSHSFSLIIIYSHKQSEKNNMSLQDSTNLGFQYLGFRSS